jgi:hypothetical protein
MRSGLPYSLQHHIEQVAGRLIREYQAVWEGLSKAEKSLYVAEYQQLWSWLSHASGQRDPVIPSPWTEDEIFNSMGNYWFGGEYMKSTNGMLSMVDSRLVTAVRATERASRRRARSTAR